MTASTGLGACLPPPPSWPLLPERPRPPRRRRRLRPSPSAAASSSLPAIWARTSAGMVSPILGLGGGGFGDQRGLGRLDRRRPALAGQVGQLGVAVVARRHRWPWRRPAAGPGRLPAARAGRAGLDRGLRPRRPSTPPGSAGGGAERPRLAGAVAALAAWAAAGGRRRRGDRRRRRSLGAVVSPSARAACCACARRVEPRRRRFRAGSPPPLADGAVAGRRRRRAGRCRLSSPPARGEAAAGVSGTSGTGFGASGLPETSVSDMGGFPSHDARASACGGGVAAGPRSMTSRRAPPACVHW